VREGSPGSNDSACCSRWREPNNIVETNGSGGRKDMNQADYEIAVRAARLWPNREHEASAVLALLCRIRIHRWRRLDLSELLPAKDISHCFWCSKVKVDGVVHDV
jgi:hypothetical protein